MVFKFSDKNCPNQVQLIKYFCFHSPTVDVVKRTGLQFCSFNFCAKSDKSKLSESQFNKFAVTFSMLDEKRWIYNLKVRN